MKPASHTNIGRITHLAWGKVLLLTIESHDVGDTRQGLTTSSKSRDEESIHKYYRGAALCSTLEILCFRRIMSPSKPSDRLTIIYP